MRSFYSNQVSLEILTSLVEVSIEKFYKIENEEIYLIIGNTGLRTPTLTNIKYLVNKNIEPIKYFYNPELYTMHGNLLMCEFPCFNYKGNKEVQLFQAMSLELVVNIAKKIRGIIIVIDYQEFASNEVSFKKLIERLSYLFWPNLEEIFKSSIFIIVNQPDNDTNEIKSKILKDQVARIDYLKNKISAAPGRGKENKSEQIELLFRQLLIFNEKQLCILNSLDNGESRYEIIGTLAKIKPIESSNFKFENFYDEVLTNVNFNLRKFINETMDILKRQFINETRNYLKLDMFLKIKML